MSFKTFLANPCVLFLIKVIRWIPVVFIVAVVVWSYYAYVYQLCICTVTYWSETIIYLLLYHVFLILFLWSYWQTMFFEIGQVPKRFHLPFDLCKQLETVPVSQQRRLLNDFARDLPVMMRTIDGSVRYCEKCKIVKPDRAHHCSVCGFCILKMDHHCPWVNTCVNYRNYKFFILFLGYALLYCLYCCVTDLQYFIKFWTNDLADRSMGRFHIMFMFFVGAMFSISVAVLFFYHIWLVTKNRSTLESFRPPMFATGPDKDGFSLGRFGNFREVFGDRTILWFLPIFSSIHYDLFVFWPKMLATDCYSRGDGVSFPTPNHVNAAVSASSHTAPDCNGVQPSNGSFAPFRSAAEGAQLETNLSEQHVGKLDTRLPPIGSKLDVFKAAETGPVQQVQSVGDGVVYPVRTFDPEMDGLLTERRRWVEDDETQSSEQEDLVEVTNLSGMAANATVNHHHHSDDAVLIR